MLIIAECLQIISVVHQQRGPDYIISAKVNYSLVSVTYRFFFFQFNVRMRIRHQHRPDSQEIVASQTI